MRTNHILVDYENVQEIDFSNLAGELRLWIFVGEKQKRVPIELAINVQALGDRAKFVQVLGTAPDALDFVIAFTIGHLSVEDPGAFFHVISEDKGYDPLIKHLKARKIFAARRRSIGDVPIVKLAKVTTPAARADVYRTKLEQPGTSRPRTKTTLSNAINATFQKQLSDKDVAAVVESLQSRKLIDISGEKVTYPGLT
jgi:hypothetical protein